MAGPVKKNKRKMKVMRRRGVRRLMNAGASAALGAKNLTSYRWACVGGLGRGEPVEEG